MKGLYNRIVFIGALYSLNSEYIKVKNQRLWYQLDSRANTIDENGYEEIRYVKGNNTMQYLPSSPWIESDTDFKTNKNLNFEIEDEFAGNFFIVHAIRLRIIIRNFQLF